MSENETPSNGTRFKLVSYLLWGGVGLIVVMFLALYLSRDLIMQNETVKHWMGELRVLNTLLSRTSKPDESLQNSSPSLPAMTQTQAVEDSNTPAFARIKQFESDIVTNDNKGHHVRAHMYADGGKVRSEMTINGTFTYVIMRKDEQKIFQLIPEQKICVVLPFNNQLNQAFDPDGVSTGVWSRLGNEDKNGYSCTKYRVVQRNGKVNDVWINTETKSPVYIAAQDGSYAVEWSNFKPGPVSPSLFEPPSDYTKTDLNIPLPDIPGTPTTQPNTPSLPNLPGLPSIPGS